jgi:hypothetical protein
MRKILDFVTPIVAIIFAGYTIGIVRPDDKNGPIFFWGSVAIIVLSNLWLWVSLQETIENKSK